jgi:branched-chain amino acid transport system ATP-binding protein/neutral amino acid transport system ATP-binding protein
LISAGRDTEPPALRADAIVAGYGEMQILHGVGIAVRQGEVVSILGPNGCGKSTLLRALAGLLVARSGTIELGGVDITTDTPRRRLIAGLAYVPQVRNVFGSMSTAENLRMGFHAFDHGYDEGERRVLAILPQLRDFWTRPAGRLSGGQQQLVALARGLITNPTVLMLDEPSAGLAPKIVDEVFATIRAIARDADVAVLLVEQSVHKALRISDRAYVLAEGHNRLDGQAADILASPEVGRIYLGAD